MPESSPASGPGGPGLSPGYRLGPYVVLQRLGAGGMGDVYAARDTRLGRTVALKVLRAPLVEDAELRQRFEREARAVSSLSHPHICALYDVGDQDGLRFLVMERLEGETLAERLGRGPLPLAAALRCALEIADALDAAHAHGVVHRDLKPENVMLTPAGAKLLDFGVAKLRPAPPLAADTGSATSPLLLTAEGTILGTFHYMAPEQLEGKDADARADIFAFGAVLYEMLTGRRAFEGRSQASLIAAVLSKEPPAASALVAAVPPALDHVLSRCLAKEPAQRWQSVRDLKSELEWVAETAEEVPAATARSARTPAVRRGGPWIAVLVLALLAGAEAALLLRRQPARGAVVRASILPPEMARIEAIALSPDGRQLAFAASGPDRRSLLFVRPLGSDAAQPIAGTEGALYPFWSPDGRVVAFFAGGKLRKVAAAGGPIESLCDTPQPRGGSWSREGVIAFAPDAGSGLYRVAATGGAATPLTRLDSARREGSHRWPYFLPDGRHVLYYLRSPDPEVAGIHVASLDGGPPRRLLATSSNAAYAPPGYLVFEREGALLAQAFDAAAQRLEGDPVPIAANVAYDGGPFHTDFAVSTDGTLAYRAAGSMRNAIVWVDRAGKRLGTVGTPEQEYNLALSSDDRRLAVSRLTSSRGTRNIWIHELQRGTSARFSFDPGTEVIPLWSPDGRRIVFSSDREGPYNLFEKPTLGAGSETLLLRSVHALYASDWSRDGRFIAYDSVDARTRLDVWILPMTGERKPAPFLNSEADEQHGHFSPDGRFLAYASNETGRHEVYVQPFPATGARWQVSAQGGVQPRWRRDGQELFYLGLDGRMMAAEVRTGATFDARVPRELFEVGGMDPFRYYNPYAVSGDGQRFLLLASVEAAAPPIHLVIDWPAGLAPQR